MTLVASVYQVKAENQRQHVIMSYAVMTMTGNIIPTYVLPTKLTYFSFNVKTLSPECA